MKNYRFEFKYEVDAAAALLIEEEIKKFGMKADSNGKLPGGQYFVTSLYFDSYDLSDFHDKAGGFIGRKKIRARIYEDYLKDSQSIVLEIKRKHDALVSKSKVYLTREEWRNFFEKGVNGILSDKPGLSREDRNDIVFNFLKSPIRPKILVRYLRKAFVNSLADNLRINFDSNLEACKGDDFEYNAFMVPVNKESLIMEVKYAYMIPYWLKILIKKHNLKKDTFSKYARSLETINRFNPITR